MVRLGRFDIEFSNPEGAYFAGQEISGKVIIENCEPKKVSEILLELKGRGRTYWTKHSGKSRKHYSQGEPYFCEQFNTCYTHKFTTKTVSGKEERILPEGRHEVPFSYTLSKSLPSSFEGEYGYIRYTCKAICERPWDFDIVSKRAFTVVGIEDINEDTKLLQPCSVSVSNSPVRFCCMKQGSVSAELSVGRTGFTPGEMFYVNAKIKNDSQKTLKSSCLRVKQNVTYRAKTFAGYENVKLSSKTVCKNEQGEVNPNSCFYWKNEKVVLPSIPPRLSSCKIIEVTYRLELDVDSVVTAAIPIHIGTIPLVSDVLARLLKSEPETDTGVQINPDAPVQVTVTDVSGHVMSTADSSVDNLSPEIEAIYSKRKRVRIPSSILSELYPSLPSPYYKESHFGKVDILDDKENVQYGEKKFAPKYPFYTD
uniref:Arrestin_C domain-containing protein n=1 Tax=Syphacia muris TaxID=451379 RepID=A0A158R5V4_9BILA